MNFSISKKIPRGYSETAQKVEAILNSKELHEEYLETQMDNYDLSNINGPELSFLIQQRRKQISIEPSPWFFYAEGRVANERIIVNANKLQHGEGGIYDLDEFTFTIGSLTAKLLIDQSAFWYNTRANPFDRGTVNPFVMLGGLCSSIYRQKEERKLRSQDGTEARPGPSQSCVHDI